LILLLTETKAPAIDEVKRQRIKNFVTGPTFGSGIIYKYITRRKQIKVDTIELISSCFMFFPIG
jgi:hypothetical protein